MELETEMEVEMEMEMEMETEVETDMVVRVVDVQYMGWCRRKRMDQNTVED